MAIKTELPIIRSIDLAVDIRRFVSDEVEKINVAEHYDYKTGQMRYTCSPSIPKKKLDRIKIPGVYSGVNNRMALVLKRIERELKGMGERGIDEIRVFHNRVVKGPAGQTYTACEFPYETPIEVINKSSENKFEPLFESAMEYLMDHPVCDFVFYFYNSEHNTYVGKFKVKLISKEMIGRNTEWGSKVSQEDDEDVPQKVWDSVVVHKTGDETLLNPSSIHSLNCNNKEKENKTMKFNGFKDLFVCKETSNIGISMMNGGITVMNAKDGVGIQCESVVEGTASIVEVPADFVMNVPAFIISTQLSAIKAGDVVETKQGLGFITSINHETAEIVAVLLTGETVAYNVPKNALFGAMAQTLPKVMMPFGNMMGGEAGANNMMNNPFMFAMLMKDGGGDLFSGDTMKTIMMMQMFNGGGGLFGNLAK